MSETAVVTPAPFNFAMLLQQFVRVYRAQWLKLIACVAITQIPAACLQLGQLFYIIPQMTALQQNPLITPSNPQAMQRMLAQSLGASMLSLAFPCALLLVQLATIPISQGTATVIVSDHLLGKPVAFIDAIRRSLSAFPRTFVVFLVSIFLIFAGVFWAIVPCFGWLTGPGALIVFGVVLYLAIPVAVLENRGVKSLLRAWNLLRKSWVMMLIVLFLTLIAFTIGFMAGVLIPASFNLIENQSLAWSLPTTSPYYAASSVVLTLVSLVLGLINGSIQMALIVVTYFDLRTRFEGLDLAKIQPAENVSERTLPVPPEDPSGNWITWREGGYLVGMSVALIAMYACIYGIIFLGVMSSMPMRGF